MWFDDARKDNYFMGEPLRRSIVGMRMKRLENNKAVVNDEVTEEMIRLGVS